MATSKPGILVRIVQQLERAGDWLNPILVKECRQALKSRQFTMMFALLLLGSWVWSIVGVVLIGADAYFGFAGPDMFFGYFIALAFALIVIVPSVAFRSLAAECEDRTFELVTITTLRPKQIVAGKLGSAVVQMVVYFSALAPCLAFTYLLRGIDILQIVFILAYLFLGSLAFSTAALLLGTVAREKHWQIVLSVLLIIGLLYAFGGSCAAAYGILEGNYIDLSDTDFWIGHALGAVLYVGYMALFFLAAAAQLTFASDNRSTALRVTMLVQYLMFIGWFAAMGTIEYQRDQSIHLKYPIIGFMTFSAFHWASMGLFMVVDQPNLSLRVKRRLPQSFLGRVFLTWFNPGPATGYMFAVSNMLGATVISLVALVFLRDLNWATSRINGTWVPFYWDEPAAGFAVLVTAYVVLYLGLGKLMIRLLRRRWPIGHFAGVVLQLALLLLGCAGPLFLAALMSSVSIDYVALVQLTNPFLILEEVANRRGFSTYGTFAIIGRLVMAVALIVFALNLPGIIREVRHVRIAKPRRVVEDDAAKPA